MTQIHFIVNRYAGGGKGQLFFEQLQSNISALDCIVHHTTDVHSIESTLLHDIDYSQLNKLIIVGGDGTLHHIVNLLHKHHITIPIGYIPAGTGNDFCRGLSLQLSPKEMLERILSSTQPVTVPILATKNFIAINSMGLGLDALVCQNVEKSRIKSLLNKCHLGSLVYIIYLIKSLFQFKTFSCQINNQHFHRVALCVVMNNAYFGGGIHLDPLLNHRDEQFSTIIVHNVSPLKIPSILWAVLKKRHLDHPCVYRQTDTSSVLSLSQSNIPLQTDGEITHHTFSPMHVTLSQQSFWL